MVEEAWRSGQLAVWTTYTDLPVPPIVHDPNGYLTGGALFQLLLSHDQYGGWPHQYHPVDNIWSPTPHPLPDYTPVWTAREVQAALSCAGEAVTVDGAWGPNSRNALIHYQQMSGLPVTGIPDSSTIDSLMASGHWLMPDYLVRSESLADQYLQWKAEQHSPADFVGAAAVLSRDALIDAGQATWVPAGDVNPASYLRRPTSAPVAVSPRLPVMPYGVMTATHFPIGMVEHVHGATYLTPAGVAAYGPYGTGVPVGMPGWETNSDGFHFEQPMTPEDLILRLRQR